MSGVGGVARQQVACVSRTTIWVVNSEFHFASCGTEKNDGSPTLPADAPLPV